MGVQFFSDARNRNYRFKTVILTLDMAILWPGILESLTYSLDRHSKLQTLVELGSRYIILLPGKHLAFSSLMLQIHVALPSGKRKSLTLPQSSKVGDLKRLAQQSFQQGFLRLVTAKGRVLSAAESLEEAGLQDQDELTAIVRQAKFVPNPEAFALWCFGGDGIVTWGNPTLGGDSSAVQQQLKSVQQVQGTHSAMEALGVSGAFAAILADGSLVTWGSEPLSSAAVHDQLKNVQQVQGTLAAFAAVLSDGSVVSWGNPALGGDTAPVQDQLRNVWQIQATAGAFCAIRMDGSVVTWGDGLCGGDSSAVQGQLKNVRQVRSNQAAFAAILSDGSAVTWGGAHAGADSGDSSAVRGQLKNVQPDWKHHQCICCHLGRRISGYVGWPRTWWRQLCSARSAQECQADSGHVRCVCRSPVRWVSCHMGRSSFWWWQLVGPTFPQECAADSGRQVAHSLPSLRMDQLLHGAIQTMVGIAHQSNLSSGTCKRSRPHEAHLLRFYRMDPSLPGALRVVVVTALQSKSSSWTCSILWCHPELIIWRFPRHLIEKNKYPEVFGLRASRSGRSIVVLRHQEGQIP